MANIRTKLPPEAVDEVLAHARAVRDAPTPQAGEAMAASPIDRFGAAYRSAVARFSDDLEASLVHLRIPARHRINVRTTNLIERSAMKLVFAVPIRAADRWCRVSVSELQRQQLKLLRRELGLDPPPAEDGKEANRRKRTAA